MKRGWITPYQANLLNQGNGRELLVGSYLLLSRLGDGGMGEVFRARHRHIRTRVVALKVIHKDHLFRPSTIQRFYREAHAVAQLSHRHIVLAYDAGQFKDTHYLAMEYVEGIDLNRLVKEHAHARRPR